MNNIKKFRLERGLTQKEVTEYLRRYDERIDSSMLSRFENELCYPTPLIMRSLCNVLKCLPEELYGVTEQEYIEDIVKETAPAVPESFSVTELVATLEYGRRNAIKRRTLSALLDVSDRHLREIIEEARNNGYVILSLPNGGGYYMSNNTDEIHDFYLREKSRAHSILCRLRPMRKILKEQGRHV